MTNPPNLAAEAKQEILQRVLKALNEKFYQPEKLGADWQKAVSHHRPAIESAQTLLTLRKQFRACSGN